MTQCGPKDVVGQGLGEEFVYMVQNCDVFQDEHLVELDELVKRLDTNIERVRIYRILKFFERTLMQRSSV